MRSVLIAAATASLLVAAACGGDDDDPAQAVSGDDNTETPSGPSPTADPNAAATTLPARPSPTPVAEDKVAVSIRAPGGGRVDLTPAQLRTIATEKVDGIDEEGVTLDTLAAQVGYTGNTVVTFRGYRPGAGSLQFAVGELSELSANTIVYITDEGQIAMKSGALDEMQWLTVVDRITFE